MENTPDNKGAAIVKKMDSLKAARHNWERHWMEVAEYIIPKKDNIYGERLEGEKKYNLLYDSTGIQSCELLASALHGMLTNPATQWFGLSTGDKMLDARDDVKKFLQDCVHVILEVLNQSNFQPQIHETYIDLGGFGTNLLRALEDDTNILRFESRPIYEAYIMENNSGVVDTVYYEYEMTVTQIFQEFGQEALDSILQAKLKDQPMHKEKVIHAVEPRAQVPFNTELVKLPKDRPYASYHVLRRTNAILRESGFHENPNIVPRWTKISGETYGRSPGMKALADIKMLNKVKKATIEAMQLVVAPPLQVPDDGVLLPIKTAPNSVNYYRAGTKDRIEPLQTGGRPDINDNFMAQIRDQIRQAFFIDQLQLVQQDRMTTLEVSHRRDEQLRMLGPVMGRLNNELLRPLIDRVFGILLRKGMLPRSPEVMKGKNLQVRYVSQIAKAQMMAEAENVTRAFQFLAPFFQVKEELLDNFSGDGMVQFASSVYGLPHEILTTKNERNKIRQGRMQAMQEQAETEQAAANAQIGKDRAAAGLSPEEE